MDYHRIIEGLTLIVELAGVAILVGGAVLATGAAAARLVQGTPPGETYHAYRADLGRGILLGLEWLVIADIIGTIAIDPTFTSLGVLAAIVLIRTFLSFALELEVTGRWPWQKERDHGK